MELTIQPSPVLADLHHGTGLTTEERAALLRSVWTTLADADTHIFGAVAGDEVSFDVRVYGTVRTLSFTASIATWFPIEDWAQVPAQQLVDLKKPVGTLRLDAVTPTPTPTSKMS